ncbi:MAG: heparinase II/III family protein [Prevotella sp.]|nr:heparinase II/III family protein [Prevotella sp.]
MKRFLILYILLCIGITAFCQQLLSSNYPRPILEDIIPTPTQYTPIPQAKDSFWKNTIPLAMRNDYIKLGEKYLGTKWEKLPDALFAEYKTNGNRTNYENKNFELRRQLTHLAMAEIMEHKGRFMKDIIQGLHYFMEEPWWGIPAHYPIAKPERSRQVVDLFNAETANLIAWTTYMLHDELEDIERGISLIIRNEINRRILIPARTIDYSWKKKTDNWNTWICSNWLSCILFCETNRQYQIEAISQIIQCLDTFYDAYADDGGCDEGIAYWTRAAGSYYECLELLGRATNGKIAITDNPKLKAMGAFVYNTYIGNNTFVNFADAKPNTSLVPQIALPFGIYTNDSILTGYAMNFAIKKKFFNSPSTLFNTSGHSTLSRELLFLNRYKMIKNIKPTEPLLRETWMPDLQVFTGRSKYKSDQGLFFAAKGGHNGETHNHNDVGNFIIYNNNKPVIIDIGVGTYTAQTFSQNRYQLFNCRSAYHNVPLINGIEQHVGAEYKAEDVTCKYDDKQATFRLDLSKAYPQEASIRKWTRTIQLNREENVTITEDYQLMKYKQPTCLVLICCEVAKQTTPGIIAIGKDHHLYFDDKQLSATIEPIRHSDALILRAWNNRTLYRILLTIKGQRRKDFVKYIVQ